MLDLDGLLGDWQGAGYSREQAVRLAQRLREIQADDGLEFGDALAQASAEIGPDVILVEAT
jgi:hypothetical protein